MASIAPARTVSVAAVLSHVEFRTTKPVNANQIARRRAGGRLTSYKHAATIPPVKVTCPKCGCKFRDTSLQTKAGAARAAGISKAERVANAHKAWETKRRKKEANGTASA